MNAEELDNNKSGGWLAGQVQGEYERRERSSAHAPPAARVSCPTPETISSLEPLLLQAYLRKRRWFASKDQELGVVRLAACMGVEAAGFAFAELEVELPNGAERYVLPLAFVWDASEIPESSRELEVALVEQRTEVRHLIDAFAIPRFACEVLAMLKSRTVVATEQWGEIRFIPTDRIDALDCADDNAPNIRWLSAEQSNSSLVIDEKVVLKLVRRLIGGVHPEAEMTRYLTARGYANAGPLFGEVVRVDTDGVPHTLCILQGFIPNDGDAWAYVLRYLRRAVDDASAIGFAPDAGAAEHDEQHCINGYREIAAAIGRRLGELHVILASPTVDEAFSPQMASTEDVRSWTNGTVALITTALDILAGQLDMLKGGDRGIAQSLLERRAAVLAYTRALVADDADALCFRIHGDFHLGQVLIANGDAYLIDFEGEPARPLDERRKKASPLRDVAGLLRSLRYASATISADLGTEPQRTGESMDRLVERLQSHAEDAFLTAYRRSLSTSSLEITGDEETFGALLQLFLLEKAAYEIRYEAANRPAWIGVPLRGLATLIDQGLDRS